MYFRPFILLAVTFLLPVFAPLQAAEVPKLDQLLAEYHKARADVITKLNAAYAVQADTLAKAYQQVKDPAHTKRATDFAGRLRGSDEKSSLDGIPGAGPANDPLVVLQTDYLHSREENLKVVDVFYTTTAQNMQAELKRKNDVAGANVMASFLEKIKPAGTARHAKTPDQAAQPTPQGQ